MKWKVSTLAVTLVLLGVVFTYPALANNEAPSHEGLNVMADANSGGGATFAASLPKVMIMSITRPMAIPNQVLEPGQYSLRLNEDDTAVAISKADESKFYGHFFIVPTSRKHVDGTAIYTDEVPGGPDRIASWFFPGQLDGYSLVYPKSKHSKLEVAAK